MSCELLRLQRSRGTDDTLQRLDRSVQIKIYKKLSRLARPELVSRHLQHGKPHFVEEAGGWRIAYIQDEKKMERRVVFIGTHKDYEKWYSQ